MEIMPTNGITQTQAIKAQPKTEIATNPIKGKEQVEDGNNKILIGLTALGAIALAGIGLYKHNKKATQEANELIGTIVDKNAGKIAQTADEAIDISSKAIREGTNYQKIRKEAARNFGQADKKTIKTKLSDLRSQQIDEAIEMSHKNSNEVMNAVDGVKQVKKTNQGMKSATTYDEIKARTIAAQQNAQSARKSSQKASEFAEINPTHQNKKRAKVAENRANEAQRQSDKVGQNATKRTDELFQESSAKGIHTFEQQSSPNYETGLAKQKDHQNVTNANARKRALSDIRKKPEYGKALSEFKRRRYTEQQLTSKVLSNPKASEIEKQAALDFLKDMKK